MPDSDEFYKSKPREQVGRDTFDRYKAQVRAAGFASLSILENDGVERVFCDYHDDFVVKKNVRGSVEYCFFQVKTKRKAKESWTLNEIFGLSVKAKDQTKQSTPSIRDSFAGKLLQHTVNFPRSCGGVIFMTNAYVDDTVEDVSECISKKDCGNKYTNVLKERFNECFTNPKSTALSDDDVLVRISKLSFETDVQHIKGVNNNFESLARGKIFEYSEVDLEFNEARQILVGLLDLVGKKSGGIITEFTEEVIDAKASVDINDLLDVLSISRAAYHQLASGGDKRAIKSVSVIQRALTSAGAGPQEIEFCSKCKTDWDIWLRQNRVKLSEMDIMEVFSHIDDILNKIIEGGKGFKLPSLRPEITFLANTLKSKNIFFDLSESLLLGGFFSALVRCKS